MAVGQYSSVINPAVAPTDRNFALLPQMLYGENTKCEQAMLCCQEPVALTKPHVVYQAVNTQVMTPFLPGMANKVITNDVDCHTRRPNVLLSPSIDEAILGHIYWLGAEV